MDKIATVVSPTLGMVSASSTRALNQKNRSIDKKTLAHSVQRQLNSL